MQLLKSVRGGGGGVHVIPYRSVRPDKDAHRGRRKDPKQDEQRTLAPDPTGQSRIGGLGDSGDRWPRGSGARIPLI